MMKRIIFNTIILIALFSCNKQAECDIDSNQKTTSITQDEVVYDSVRAQEIGADDYGMKKYVMAFLKKGPNRDLDSVRAMELQRAHLDNISKMADEGKLVLAGPFFGSGEIRGIYIFDVPSIEEAEALTNTDPAIQEGSLVMELKEWYGSAALCELNDIHKKIAKINI